TGVADNYTLSLTVGNNANRLLYVVIVFRGNSSSMSAPPQFNGVALTQSKDGSGNSHMPRMWAGYLVAPATGAHNLTWTLSGAGTDVVCVYVASLYNCAQTGQLDAFVYAGDDSLSPGIVNGSIAPPSVGSFLMIVSAGGGYVSGA